MRNKNGFILLKIVFFAFIFLIFASLVFVFAVDRGIIDSNKRVFQNNNSDPIALTPEQEQKVLQDIERFLSYEDPNFSDVRGNVDTSSWPVFTHPKGIYKLRYHPNLKPIIMEPVECNIEEVIFEPINPQQNTNFDQKYSQSARISNKRENPFEISIFGSAYGGGVWCKYADCTDISRMETDLESYNAHISFLSPEIVERGGIRFGEYLGLEEVMSEIVYPFEGCGLYVRANYFSNDQRNTVRNMVKTIEYLDGPFE